MVGHQPGLSERQMSPRVSLWVQSHPFGFYSVLVRQLFMSILPSQEVLLTPGWSGHVGPDGHPYPLAPMIIKPHSPQEALRSLPADVSPEEP